MTIIDITALNFTFYLINLYYFFIEQFKKN